ncbi:ead/Ea22-like family protein [Klebsiella pneumoniae]|nr:ead/Ea22-like family protein [Klebsiella pneumoniae]
MNDITELAQTMKAAAAKASGGDWVKESGDGWDATCSNDDQANSGFIIAHFVGPDSEANREFVQLANPANILALVEALEKAQQQTTESENRVRKQNRHICELFDDNTALRQRIAGLEARTVKLPDLRQIVSGDRYVWSDGVYNYSQDVKVALAAAGIKVEVE